MWFDDGRGGGPATQFARYDQYGDELFMARFEKLIKEHPPEKPLFVYAVPGAPFALQSPRKFLAKYTEFRDIKGDNDWHYVERNGLGLSRQEA